MAFLYLSEKNISINNGFIYGRKRVPIEKIDFIFSVYDLNLNIDRAIFSQNYKIDYLRFNGVQKEKIERDESMLINYYRIYFYLSFINRVYFKSFLKNRELSLEKQIFKSILEFLIYERDIYSILQSTKELQNSLMEDFNRYKSSTISKDRVDSLFNIVSSLFKSYIFYLISKNISFKTEFLSDDITEDIFNLHIWRVYKFSFKILEHFKLIESDFEQNLFKAETLRFIFNYFNESIVHNRRVNSEILKTFNLLRELSKGVNFWKVIYTL